MGFLSKVPSKVREWLGAPSAGAAPEGAMAASVSLSSPGSIPARYLQSVGKSSNPPVRHPLHDRLEIGRAEAGRVASAGELLLENPGISWRHCILTQSVDGRCFVRDLSRNGTRLDGRRLLPSQEVEVRVGQTLDLGSGFEFKLCGEPALAASAAPVARGKTEVEPNLTVATVLVGDIRDYTVLVREAPSAELQQSVSRVFERLTAAVEELGGTMKEFPGDAVLAFWEGAFRGEQALAACRAAIDLDRLVRRLAVDPGVWSLQEYPLRMDWALATGQVVIDSFGGDTSIGLSMVGEPMVLACRLEKLATDDTGPIVTCHLTRHMATTATRLLQGDPLEFVDLGPMQCKGFDEPEQVFALRVPAT